MPSDLRIKITIDAEKAIQRMKDMQRRSMDFKPVFRWAKKELGLMNGQNFAQHGLPVGGWSPLNPKYSAWKATKFPGSPDMVISKKLFNSLRNLNGPANSIGLKKATFGTHIEYAKFHQYGTTKMPKRKLVYEPRGFAERVALLSARHVADGKLGVATGDLAFE